ncbi:MAG: Eco57I restriction-modification methylase domain-containing protein [Candidatus Odinarchaeota archaeon]
MEDRMENRVKPVIAEPATFYPYFNFIEHTEVLGEFYSTYVDYQSKLAKQISGLDDDRKGHYALILFNRLIFLFFLQKRRFLARDNHEENYLQSAWIEINRAGKNYYRDFLLPLFFYLLPYPEDYEIRKKAKKLAIFGNVPFFNANLFKKVSYSDDKSKQQNSIEEPENTEIYIPNHIFEEIFSFLQSYEWHIRSESSSTELKTPKGKKIVNPEILGHIFERSTAVAGYDFTRCDLGAFYTPGFVTRMMTRETIEKYILKQVQINFEKDCNSIEQLIEKNQPTTLLQIYEKIISPITVLDNAVGSGAFLVAACEVLLDLKTRFKLAFGEEINEFDIVHEIIEKNLFGVDISEGAVQTCHLRLWLFLAGYMDPGNPVPLPNLEFRVVNGNSLLGFGFDRLPEQEKKATRSFKPDIVSKYINIYDPVEREKAKKEIDAYLSSESDKLTLTYSNYLQKNHKITRNKNWLQENSIFHWSVHFPQVKQLDGFDIVLGNPPWGSRAKGAVLSNQEKEIIKNLHPSWGNNLYGAFWSRTLALLKSNGWACYIVPDTLITIKTFSYMRILLLKNTIHKMTLFGDNIFRDAPAMGSLVFQIEKSPATEDHKVTVIDGRHTVNKSMLIKSPSPEQVFTIDQKIWNETKHHRFLYGISPRIMQYCLKDSAIDTISTSLGEVKQGLATGDNKRFLKPIEGVKKEDIGYEKEDFIVKGKKWARFAKGGNIVPYHIDLKEVVLWEKNGHEIRSQRHPRTGRLKARVQNESYYFKEGITFKGLGVNNLCAALLPKDCIFGHKSNTIFLKKGIEKYKLFLLGYLNGFIAQFFKSRCINTGKMTEIMDMAEFPIVLPDDANLIRINELVIKAVNLKTKNRRANVKDIQKEIDSLIMKIFKLEKEDFEPVHSIILEDVIQ